MTNEISIKIGGRVKTAKVPDTWNDLDTKSLLLFYESIFSNPGDEFTASSFTVVKLIGMAQIILGVDTPFLLQWEGYRKKEDPVHGATVFLSELKSLIRYALTAGAEEAEAEGLFSIEEDGDETKYSVNLNLTKNHWPVLVGPGRTKKQKKRIYYAPADGLANLSIYELGMVFSTFEAYLSTGHLEQAHRLIAILYRPSRPDSLKERESRWGGDRRQPLRGYESKVDERALLVSTMPLLVKRVIVFWFASCRQEIVKEYPKVFKSSSGANGGSDYGWGGVLLSVAEAGPLGALSEVADQHYSNVLTYLSMKADEAKEREKSTKKARR